MRKLLIVVLTFAIGMTVSMYASGSDTEVKKEFKGENLEMKTEKTTTAAGETGVAKFKVKKGAITNLKIEWTYFQEGDNYITEYTVKDKENKALLDELGLTPIQASLIKPGKHKVTSTSPFTGEDIQNNIKAVILKDLKVAVTQTPTPTTN